MTAPRVSVAGITDADDLWIGVGYVMVDDDMKAALWSTRAGTPMTELREW
jgi:hypothetical protein